MIYYYSGCGNSRMVAGMLADELSERTVFIPEADRNRDYVPELADGEALGFVFPVYCWAPPRLVLDFVSRLQLNARPSYIYAVMTYGDEAGLAEQVFRKALKRLGLELDACFGMVMPETYVNLKGMKLDTPELARTKITDARGLVPTVAARIRVHDRCSDVHVGGSAWLKTYAVRPFFYRFLVDDRHFHITDDCIGCGTCAEVCPLENIVISGGRPHWMGNCTTCNACYHNCPTGAIRFGKATEGKGQYKAIREFLKEK